MGWRRTNGEDEERRRNGQRRRRCSDLLLHSSFFAPPSSWLLRRSSPDLANKCPDRDLLYRLIPRVVNEPLESISADLGFRGNTLAEGVCTTLSGTRNFGHYISC